jgi:hypothetical protein
MGRQGAYADSTRTVLLMHVDPLADLWINTSITDQFFRSYRMSGGSENLNTGDMSMQFEPLAWPDAITGARITLHVPQLETPSHETVAGTWELTATLGVDVAKSLRSPAPGDLGPAHFSFTSVSYTPATIEVDVHVTGASAEDLNRMVPGNGGKEGPALQIEMLDPNGQIVNGNGAGSGDNGATDFHVFGFRTGGGGNYVVRVSYYGYGSFDRVVSIPS